MQVIECVQCLNESGRLLYGVPICSLDAFFNAVDKDSGGTVDHRELEQVPAAYSHTFYHVRKVCIL